MFWSLFFIVATTAIVFFVLNDVRKTRIYSCNCWRCEEQWWDDSQELRADDGPYCQWCGGPMVFEETLLDRSIGKIRQFVQDCSDTVEAIRWESPDAEERYVNGEIDEEQLERVVELEQERETVTEVDG